MRVHELAVGDRVGVARMANRYGPDMSIGLYRVIKKNRVRIVLERETDGYQVHFSARFGYRLMGQGQVDYDTYVESVEAQQAREARKAQRAELVCVWDQLEQAARRRQLGQAQELLTRVQQLETEYYA